MKRSKFSEQQIAFILRQAEDARVKEVRQKAGTACKPDTTTKVRRTGRVEPVVRGAADG